MTDTQSLANDLAAVSEVTEPKAKKGKKAEEVEAVTEANTEAETSLAEQETSVVNGLMDEIILLKEQLAAKDAPEIEEEGEPSEFFYEGIKSPEYRLKTVYLPFHAKGIQKANGYDTESGESYVYTPVKVAHQPPGAEFHRMETFNIRLDSRVIVPAFVAEVLGDRCDPQDYEG